MNDLARVYGRGFAALMWLLVGVWLCALILFPLGMMAEQSIWRLLLGEGMRGEPTVLPVGRELLDLMVPAARGWIAAAVPELDDPDGAAELLVGQMVTGFVQAVFRPELEPASIAEAGARVLTAALLP